MYLEEHSKSATVDLINWSLRSPRPCACIKPQAEGVRDLSQSSGMNAISLALSLSYFNGSNLDCFSSSLHQTSSSCPHWILSTVMAMVSYIRFYLGCLVVINLFVFQGVRVAKTSSKASNEAAHGLHKLPVHLRVLGHLKSTRDACQSAEHLV